MITINKINQHYGLFGTREATSKNPWTFIVETTNQSALEEFKTIPEYKEIMKSLCEFVGTNKIFMVGFKVDDSDGVAFSYKYTITSCPGLSKSPLFKKIFDDLVIYSSEDQSRQIRKIKTEDNKNLLSTKLIKFRRQEVIKINLCKFGIIPLKNFGAVVDSIKQFNTNHLLHRHHIKEVPPRACYYNIRSSWVILFKIAIIKTMKILQSEKIYKSITKMLISHEINENMLKVKLKKERIISLCGLFINILYQKINRIKVVVENNKVVSKGDKVYQHIMLKINKAIKNGELHDCVIYCRSKYSGIFFTRGSITMHFSDNRKYKTQKPREIKEYSERSPKKLSKRLPNLSGYNPISKTSKAKPEALVEAKITIGLSFEEQDALKIAAKYVNHLPRAKRPIQVDQSSRFFRNIIKNCLYFKRLIVNHSNKSSLIISFLPMLCWNSFEVINISRNVLYAFL